MLGNDFHLTRNMYARYVTIRMHKKLLNKYLIVEFNIIIIFQILILIIASNSFPKNECLLMCRIIRSLLEKRLMGKNIGLHYVLLTYLS